MDIEISTKRYSALVLQNNEAISILNGEEHSQCAQAVQKLSSALSDCKKILQASNARKVGPRSNPTSTLPQHHQESLDELMAQNRKRDTPCQLASVDESDKYFVYDYGIYLRDSPVSNFDHQTGVQISSIVIFNLALAHQLFSLQLVSRKNQTRQKALLHRAATLYNLAYRLQLAEHLTLQNNWFFCMAILNNLGLVYLELQEFDKADDIFERLLSVLMPFVSSKTAIEDPRIMEFFYNSIKATAKKPYFAAAA